MLTKTSQNLRLIWDGGNQGYRWRRAPWHRDGGRGHAENQIQAVWDPPPLPVPPEASSSRQKNEIHRDDGHGGGRGHDHSGGERRRHEPPAYSVQSINSKRKMRIELQSRISVLKEPPFSGLCFSKETENPKDLTNW